MGIVYTLIRQSPETRSHYWLRLANHPSSRSYVRALPKTNMSLRFPGVQYPSHSSFLDKRVRRSGQLNLTWLSFGDEPLGGVRQFTLAMASALRNEGCSITMGFFQQGPFHLECCTAGFNTFISNVPRMAFIVKAGFGRNTVDFFGQKAAELRYVAKLTEELTQRPLDILHFRKQELLGIVGMAARLIRKPATWHMPNALGSGYTFNINRLLYQTQCRLYGVVPIANSAYTASSIAGWLIKTEVLPLGVDEIRFSPTIAQVFRESEFGIEDSQVVFGMFARLVPEKGQHVVLEALLRLNRKDIHLLLVGDPVDSSYAQQLLAMAKKACWDNLHLVRGRSDIERFYGAVDVAVNARLDPEPFGLTIVEAMMMCKPVLVVPSGEPANIVLDGVTGWHVTTTSVEAFRDAFIRVLDDRSHWRAMGEAGRNRAVLKYNMRDVAKHYLAIVEQRCYHGTRPNIPKASV